jgi:hypothetical protein
MPRMKPPQGATGVTYNGTIVGADGVEVAALDVDALEHEGWTKSEPTDPPAED